MPTTTVGAIIIDNINNPKKVLLTQRNIPPFKGYWCLPGGHIDQYEKAEEAVKREVKEETGLNFTPCFMHYFDEIFKEGNVHNIVLMYYGTSQGNMVKQENEVADIQWFSFKDAIKLDLAFTHGIVLNEFMKRYSIK